MGNTLLTALLRKHGTNRAGTPFDVATIQAVWNKGQIVPGTDSSKMRKDACGAWIYRDQYGVTTPNGTGWEIDHVIPVAKGGFDNVINLQPLQWENNRHKGDNYPDWSCRISAKN